MSQEAGLPRGFWGTVQKMIDTSIAAYARSGANRNTSMTGGSDFRLQGGRFRVLYPTDQGGGDAVYFGDIYSTSDPGQLLGTGMLFQAADGADIVQIRNNATTGQTFMQIRDTNEQLVLNTETGGTGGLGRPYFTVPFYPVRTADMGVATTSATWETLYAGGFHKQHPALTVQVRAVTDTAGTTGEVRALVNGATHGDLAAVTADAQTAPTFYALPADPHFTYLSIEIQARRTAGTGAVRVAPITAFGRGV